MTLAAAAMLCALVRAVSVGKKGQEKLLRFLCGIFLLATALGPLGLLQIPQLPDFADSLRQEAQAQADAAQQQSRQEMISIIQRNTAAYILDKATELGLDVAVEVELDAEMKPYRVQISGAVSPYGKRRLAAAMEEELEIPAERQRWS